MFKFLLLSVALFAVCYAADKSSNSKESSEEKSTASTKHVPLALPAVLQDMIPKETQTSLDELTPEQHTQLELAFRKYGYNATAVSAELEEKHPELAKKVSETMGKFEKKVKELNQEGKEYIGKVIKTLQSLKTEKDLKQAAKTLIYDWNELSDETKKNVMEQFPSIPKVLKSEKFQKIATSD